MLKIHATNSGKLFPELPGKQQHANVDRIFRVVGHRSIKGEVTTTATGSFKMAEESRNTVPEIENVDCWIFIVAATLAAAIAFLTVTYQAVKAAMTNPVNSLRSE